ncbi:MAG: Rieske (2Fe-2S) protein [Actinomycetota bacterium]
MAEWIRVADEGEIGEGQVVAFPAGDRAVAVANVGGELLAFDDQCTHRRCSLAEGDLAGSGIVCPCHGATFDVRSGEVLTGPATEALPTYEVRVRDGGIEVSAG